MKKIMHRDGKNSAFTAIFHHIAMHSTELSHEAPHALKGQKLLAQGSALGIMDANLSPCFTLIEQALSVFFNVNYI